MFPEAQARRASAQGRNANLTGKTLESRVALLLEDCGYRCANSVIEPSVSAYYVQQYRGYRSIYDTEIRLDFYAWHPERYPAGLAIECKYQESAGSVDEKYPYMLENLRNTGCAAILIVDGNGARPGALEWCKRQAEINPWFRFYHTYQAFRRAVMKEGLL